MVERLQTSGEFERKPSREIEKKYLPLFPQKLDIFRNQARPIEQLYLSHPDEEFSLRLREELQDGERIYSATLKDRGTLGEDGLDRLEVETRIDAEAYCYYKNLGLPILKKLRTEPYKNIVIDWFEDGHVHAEAEHPISWTGFLDDYRLPANHFIDMTGHQLCDNEWRAHSDYQRLRGADAMIIPPQIGSETIARSIYERYQRSSTTIVTIAGRSGSGKSTLIKEIQALLNQNDIHSIVMSTDDYHRGKTWLEQYKGSEWTNWDARIVYDIEAMEKDLICLQEGYSVQKRRFDFELQEPVTTGLLEPAPVILVEGIYARANLFDRLVSLRYEVPTPLATCIGRRLLRDLRERPQFTEMSENLRYILEYAEPSYQTQITQR